jgi:hypothetical protein
MRENLLKRQISTVKNAQTGGVIRLKKGFKENWILRVLGGKRERFEAGSIECGLSTSLSSIGASFGWLARLSSLVSKVKRPSQACQGIRGQIIG